MLIVELEDEIDLDSEEGEAMTEGRRELVEATREWKFGETSYRPSEGWGNLVSQSRSDQETLSVERGEDSVQRVFRRLVELAKREHYNCDEDNWYGCPLSRDGCSREIPKECDCGAETHNAEVVKLAVELETLLAKSLRPEH
jgi:hypothetical protein